MFVCAVFERIRRLRKSPQYLLVILENDSLRNSPQSFHNNCAEKCRNPGSQDSLPEIFRWGGSGRAPHCHEEGGLHDEKRGHGHALRLMVGLLWLSWPIKRGV